MADKVNEKSTKIEIWAAYKELLEGFRAGPVAVTGGNTKLNELGVLIEQSKSDLLTKLDAAREVVDNVTDGYVSAEQMLAKRKAEIIDELERSRADLQAAIDKERKNWDQEQIDCKRLRQREVEEYTYELNKKRRTEEESFQTKWQTKFAEINARETTLKNQEDQLRELELAVSKAPEQLQKAVKEACDTLAKELKMAHDAELKESRQQSDHQKNILELKLQTAELSIAAKDKQLVDLQKQLDNASTQLKDMAVTVIRAANVQGQTTGSTTS